MGLGGGGLGVGGKGYEDLRGECLKKVETSDIAGAFLFLCFL